MPDALLRGQLGDPSGRRRRTGSACRCCPTGGWCCASCCPGRRDPPGRHRVGARGRPGGGACRWPAGPRAARPARRAARCRVSPDQLTGTVGGSAQWASTYDAVAQPVRLPRPARGPGLDGSGRRRRGHGVVRRGGLVEGPGVRPAGRGAQQRQPRRAARAAAVAADERLGRQPLRPAAARRAAGPAPGAGAHQRGAVRRAATAGARRADTPAPRAAALTRAAAFVPQDTRAEREGRRILGVSAFAADSPIRYTATPWHLRSSLLHGIVHGVPVRGERDRRPPARPRRHARSRSASTTTTCSRRWVCCPGRRRASGATPSGCSRRSPSRSSPSSTRPTGSPRSRRPSTPPRSPSVPVAGDRRHRPVRCSGCRPAAPAGSGDRSGPAAAADRRVPGRDPGTRPRGARGPGRQSLTMRFDQGRPSSVQLSEVAVHERMRSKVGDVLSAIDAAGRAATRPPGSPSRPTRWSASAARVAACATASTGAVPPTESSPAGGRPRSSPRSRACSPASPDRRSLGQRCAPRRGPGAGPGGRGPRPVPPEVADAGHRAGAPARRCPGGHRLHPAAGRVADAVRCRRQRTTARPPRSGGRGCRRPGRRGRAAAGGPVAASLAETRAVADELRRFSLVKGADPDLVGVTPGASRGSRSGWSGSSRSAAATRHASTAGRSATSTWSGPTTRPPGPSPGRLRAPSSVARCSPRERRPRSGTRSTTSWPPRTVRDAAGSGEASEATEAALRTLADAVAQVDVSTATLDGLREQLLGFDRAGRRRRPVGPAAPPCPPRSPHRCCCSPAGPGLTGPGWSTRSAAPATCRWIPSPYRRGSRSTATPAPWRRRRG